MIQQIGGRRANSRPNTRREMSRKEWRWASRTKRPNVSRRLLKGVEERARKRDLTRHLPERLPARDRVRGLPCDGLQCGVCFPCGQGRHVLHARCAVEALDRGAALAPLHCPEGNREAGTRCGTHWNHRRRGPSKLGPVVRIQTIIVWVWNHCSKCGFLRGRKS